MKTLLDFICNDKVLVFLLLLISFLAVNGWSYWGDELSTVLLASQNSFHNLLTRLGNWSGSESQMPLFVILMWLWEKVFGYSEFAMRSFNILMIALLLAYTKFLAIPKLNQTEQIIIKVALVYTIISPFILYNMNEARVNISLLTLAYVCYIGLYIGLKYSNDLNFWMSMISLCLGFAFNMLFAFIVPTILIMAFCIDKKFLRKHYFAILWTLILCIFIGLYYLWTFSNGKGGSVENPGIKNIAFSLYQFLGFEGMGPEKNAIRLANNLLISIRPYYFTLMLMCVSYLLILIQIIRYRICNKFLSLFIISFIIFLVCSCVVHFRFWGRHLIMFYPLWAISFAIYVYEIWIQDIFAKSSIVVFAILLVVSSIRIESLSLYKKENIRGEIAYVNDVNKAHENVYYIGVDYPIKNYIVNNKVSLSSFNSDSHGYMLFMKNMAIFNKAQYNIENPYYDTTKYDYKVLREDKDAILYYFKPKCK